MQLLKGSNRAAKAADDGGFTLIELMVVVMIMVAVGAMVMSSTLNLVRLVMLNTDQNIAETSGRNFLVKMMEDVRAAGETTVAGAFWAGSDDKRIYITKYGQNLDSFAGTGDSLFDVVCYAYTPPSPSAAAWGSPSYVPGSVSYGITAGDSKCLSSGMTPITDRTTDVMDFKIEYCRPAPGVPGTYSCGTVITQPGTYMNNSSCVWQVRVQAKFRKTYNTQKMGQGPVVSMTSSAKPRNVYMKAMGTDANDNRIIDCCDAVFVGSDVDWCPSPTVR